MIGCVVLGERVKLSSSDRNSDELIVILTEQNSDHFMEPL